MWLMLMVIGKRRDEGGRGHETRKIIIQINSSRGKKFLRSKMGCAMLTARIDHCLLDFIDLNFE